MTAGDLDRVLADIDSLLPPGAPSIPDSSGERWEDDAMRWQPVDHDDHPTVPPPSARRPVRVLIPRRTAARNASPATHGTATLVVGQREDGTWVAAFDGAWP